MEIHTLEDIARNRQVRAEAKADASFLVYDFAKLRSKRDRGIKLSRREKAALKEEDERWEKERARARANRPSQVTPELFDAWIRDLPEHKQIELRAGRELLFEHDRSQPAESFQRWDRALNGTLAIPGLRRAWLARIAELKAERGSRLLADQPTWERPPAVEKALELAHAAVAKVDAANNKLRKARTDVSLLGYELRDKLVDGTAEEDIAVVRAQLRAEKKRANEQGDAIEAAAEEARQPIDDFRAAEHGAVALLRHRQADYEAKIRARIAAARVEFEEAEAQLEAWEATAPTRAAALPNPNRTASDLQAVVDRALEAALDTSAHALEAVIDTSA